MKATCHTFAAMLAYVLDQAQNESANHPHLTFNEVTRQITRPDNTAPRTNITQGVRVGPRNSTATKPTGADTLNVLSFRAIKGMCTKCGQYGHFRYPNLRGDGCPLAENDTSCLKATKLDEAEGYLESEPYTQMWKVMKADRAEEKRQRGTQQVAMKSRLQIGPNPMAARLQIQDPKNASAPG